MGIVINKGWKRAPARLGRRGSWALVAVSAAGALMLAGCGSDSGVAGGSAAAGTGRVSVVASTDVWGDVVKQVVGNLPDGAVQVSSIITDPSADPHSYEANARTQLALSKANVVVENGGGYDDFVDTMLKAADNPDATVLSAVAISGYTAPAGGDLNEHVWYDFPTVAKVATRVAAALGSADPADAARFRANAQAFAAKLTGLERSEAAIRREHHGEGAAITEPVPVYLLQACGLVNQTPAAFSTAIEDGTDVSADVLQQTLDLFSRHRVRLLAYNEQTSGPETQEVLQAADAAGVPVVPVTETLPQGKDYLTWMRANVAAIRSALG